MIGGNCSQSMNLIFLTLAKNLIWHFSCRASTAHTHHRTSSCLRLSLLKNRIRSLDIIARLASVFLCLFYVDKFLISFYNITMNYLSNPPEIFAALTERCSMSDFCWFFYTFSPPKNMVCSQNLDKRSLVWSQ